MTKSTAVTFAVIALFASTAFASPTDCPQFYLSGEAPDFINPKLAPKTRELCNEEYAVKHSGITRTPLYAAELVTSEGVRRGKGLPRSNSFRPDLRLPATERSELADFARSGLDRGHIFAAADSTTASSKDESFLLSNIVPQDRENNRGVWSDIEAAVRKEAVRRGKVFVLSGPLYQGSQVKALKGRVLVPTGLYKAVLDPLRQEAAAYLVANAPGDRFQIISIAELENMAGINLFPTLPSRVKNTVMQLPAPNSNKGRKGGQR